jgi:glycosyltransferase involved in cell wall biosynthesis
LFESQNVLSSTTSILFITHSFPPAAEVGGFRAAHLCKYLPEHKIQPIVLASKEDSYTNTDSSLEIPAEIRVERAASWSTPLDWYRRLRPVFRRSKLDQERENGEPNSYASSTGWWRHNLLVLLQTPDRNWGWYVPAVRNATRLIEKKQVKAIFSSAPPWSSHLIARHLKLKYKLPWIADFRDPWFWDGASELPKWRRRFDRKMQLTCVRLADRVLCNTERVREMFVSMYPCIPAGKFVTLTNGFDDSPFSVASIEKKHGPRLLLHAGEIYGLRRIDTFCEAVAILIREGKIDSSQFDILFVGHMDQQLLTTAQTHSPEIFETGRIRIQPRVSWEEAQKNIARADLLLLFQGGHLLQVPAKFYEYLQSGRPIFAVATEGALTDILEETGAGIWANPADPQEIAAKLLEALKLPAVLPSDVQERFGKYHYRALTSRLAEWIKEEVRAPSSE